MITLQNVSFRYGTGGDASGGVREVDLHIRKGDCVVLCGRSGCGKTTLTRLVNGLIPHFYEGVLSGEVRVGGRDSAARSLAKTAEIVGSVFQNPRSQFFNVDTTGELAFGCENQGLPREEILRRVDGARVLFGLDGLMDRSIFELSGGEKQRIACGSVYAAGPEVYVLDEPSANLDAGATEKLRQILAALKARGKTLLISEHRLYYLAELADMYLYMEDGRVTRALDRREMRALPPGERAAMGLRSLDLNGADYRGRAAAPRDGGALLIENLVCRRGRRRVLDIPRLSLPSGEILAVVGANGAGKSTFAHCLGGILRHKGTFSVDGKALSDKKRVEMSYMVMQDVSRQLFTESVLEELSLGRREAPVKEAEDLLRALGLYELRDKHPMALSGGQKQRLAVAAAAFAGKEILLYDEPTSGLDAVNMRRICALIQDMADRVFITAVITHDLEFILSCCTSVLELSGGTVTDHYALDGPGVEKIKRHFLKEVVNYETKGNSGKTENRHGAAAGAGGY
ncbi:energy-coupling factor transport system ATP-binding protein [Sporobacter termitidis DSM 10068]|uniref:Energy-coupling factor transport system ATP-binding protein n=1 Tax=Sporobacter termitidis DSM 10068 TaxID=1123282 RepID=A0A1M5ZFP8_9FIRM|nr:ABC transporter ATP-binding protein [Sporobacter termitidis]SHI23088.1 energy-coupling factor transport system ATP-binding protein [Sporobacter termitidis DSM 10068]